MVYQLLLKINVIRIVTLAVILKMKFVKKVSNMNHTYRSQNTEQKTDLLLYCFVIFSLASFYAFYSATTLEAQSKTNSSTSSSYIIEFQQNPSSSTSPREIIADAGGTISHVFEKNDAIFGVAASLSPDDIAAIQKIPQIKNIVLDKKVSAFLKKTPRGISRIDADLIPLGHAPADANIALIDTGIDREHPDLSKNIEEGKNFTTSDPDAWNDQHGHGTHLAGIIGARDNNQGVLGVVPKANLFIAKSMDKNGTGKTSDIIASIEWLREQSEESKIDVINMSFGGEILTEDDPLHRAIKAGVEDGITFVAGAGNGSEPVDKTVPAAYPEVITVSAMDPDTNQFAPFSNYGEAIDLTAPGIQILSTYKGQQFWRFSGTSAAAAHVSGAAALYIHNQNRNVTPKEVETFLKESGMEEDWKGDPDGNHEPMVNALRAAFGTRTAQPEEPGTVTDVVDGDTIKITFQDGREETIRLLGVDTPETGSDDNSPDEFLGVPENEKGKECLGKWGDKATAFAKEKLLNEQVKLVLDPGADRRGFFGRLLGYIKVNGTNFNLDLMKKGLARAYDSPHSMKTSFFREMFEAQEEFEGLWSCAKESIKAGTSP